MTCPHWEHSSGEDTDGDCGHEIYYKLGCDNCPLVLANYQQEAENTIHKLNAKQADKNLSLSLGGYTLQEVSDKFRNSYISREQAEKYGIAKQSTTPASLGRSRLAEVLGVSNADLHAHREQRAQSGFYFANA